MPTTTTTHSTCSNDCYHEYTCLFGIPWLDYRMANDLISVTCLLSGAWSGLYLDPWVVALLLVIALLQ